MPNKISAKKRVLVSATKKGNNVPKKSAMKTAIRKAIENTSDETVREANKRIDKALASGIIKKNKAAREKSRIAKKNNTK